MTSPVIALKVDVDTYSGTRDGVPRLLGILDAYDIHATFYFSMGPDNSGKAIRRIFTRKGFLKKMLRTRAPSAYGLRTLLYGTLLPAPRIAASFPDVLKRTLRAGHEVGIHCWDHVHWHDHLPKMRMDEVRGEFEKSCGLFREIVGQRAETTAAPGWTVSAASLGLQDTLGLRYSSDSRGCEPFYPVFHGRRFTTLQIPTTLPTADEVLGTEDITTENINDYYLSLIKPGLNVHTIHAEMEGGCLSGAFTDLLRRLVDGGARFCTLRDAAQSATLSTPPHCVLTMGEIPGRAGLVAVQGERVV
jgi:peptidoglycan/xylan/chitin deacetylase (PgdA/CDA1 family)